MKSNFVKYSITIIATFVVTLLLITIIDNSNELNRKEVTELNSTIQYIRQSYYKDLSDEEINTLIMQGLCKVDKYSRYYTKEEYDRYLSNPDNFCGIGVRTIQKRYNNTVIITEVTEGSPAEKAGLQVDDVIVSVDDIDITESDVDVISDLIRGEEGTDVKIGIVRDLDELEFTITRAPILNKQVSYEIDDDIAIVKIDAFDGDADVEFTQTIQEIRDKKINKLIIDLRDNMGGDVDMCNNIVSELVPQGTLVAYYDKKGKETVVETIDKVKEADFDIVILCNEYTASASEIMIGCLQDYGYATIIGETTYGKGVVQSMCTFDNGTAMKITTHTYKTPKGRDIDEVGITPDITIIEDDKMLEKAKEVLDK